MIYPETLTTNHQLSIQLNGTQITIEDNQNFKIKNVVVNTSEIATEKKTFTIPNTTKTYHLRFSLTGTLFNNYNPESMKFYLIDTTNTSYNPSALPADDASFSSTNTDMLVATIKEVATVLTVIPVANLTNAPTLGFVYMQAPNSPAPSEIWSGTVWEHAVPDGAFLRQVGGNANVDNVTALTGTVQNDAFQGHNHRIRLAAAPAWNAAQAGANNSSHNATERSSVVDMESSNQATTIISNGTNGTPRTANETRPTNIAVRWWKRIA